MISEKSWRARRLTFHHNWWGDNILEEMPRVRHGQVHIFNNYYSPSGNNYRIGAGWMSKLVVENNVFDGANEPGEIETGTGLVPLMGVESINRGDGSDQCVTMRDACRKAGRRCRSRKISVTRSILQAIDMHDGHARVSRSLRSTCFGLVLAVAGCSEIAGIDAIPCVPACKDETTRIVCDAKGNALTEICPPSKEECAIPACQGGACTFKAAVGAPCGYTGSAQCNEGFACMGGSFFLATLHRHTCLTTEDGKVWCWGDNMYGQLGNGTEASGLHPVLVQGLPGPALLAETGYGHTCAVVRSGEVYCWGNNHDGQCGVAPSEPTWTPVPVHVPGIRFIAVLPADKHTCALAEDKTVYCWGSTEYGQCGVDPVVTGLHIVGPTKVSKLGSVDFIGTVKDHTCAARSEAPTLMCWGSNSHIQLRERSFVNGKLGPAAGDLPYSAAPIPVDVGTPVIWPSAGAEATYALGRDGHVYAWGENDRAQLGVESRERIVQTPTRVQIGTDVGLVPLAGVIGIIRTSGFDRCVEMANRTGVGAQFLCWGTDDWGELGLGTREGARAVHRHPIPVRALPPESTRLVRGEDHACAVAYVRSRSEIWCYGRPGALGNGTARAEEGDLPSQWQGTPVVWDPANFPPAFE
jgi:alpha-tubulin suppressor-like RCC1 family protein